MNIIKKVFSSRKTDRKATRVVSEKRENEKKGETIMPEEMEKKVEEQPKEEMKEEKEQAPIDKEDKVEDSKPPIEDKGKEEQCENCDEKEDEVEEQPNQVAQTEERGNGIRIEDLVTKDLLSERLSAMESKMEALINENKSLTDKLSKMSEKYEEKDFGGQQKQGFNESDKVAYDTFEEYSKQFM